MGNQEVSQPLSVCSNKHAAIKCGCLSSQETTHSVCLVTEGLSLQRGLEFPTSGHGASRWGLSNGVHPTQLLQLQHVVASCLDPARESRFLSCCCFSKSWRLAGTSAQGPPYRADTVSANSGVLLGPQQRGPVYTAAPAATHGGISLGPCQWVHPVHLEMSQPQENGNLMASQPLECKVRVATLMRSTCCISMRK